MTADRNHKVSAHPEPLQFMVYKEHSDFSAFTLCVSVAECQLNLSDAQDPERFCGYGTYCSCGGVQEGAGARWESLLPHSKQQNEQESFIPNSVNPLLSLRLGNGSLVVWGGEGNQFIGKACLHRFWKCCLQQSSCALSAQICKAFSYNHCIFSGLKLSDFPLTPSAMHWHSEQVVATPAGLWAGGWGLSLRTHPLHHS